MRSPAVKAFSLGVVTGSFLTAGIVFGTTSAKASPDSDAAAYAAEYAPAVCSVLDEYPSFSGIVGIGQAIVEDGLTARQAGQVMAISVTELCPWHVDLLLAFANKYGGGATT